MVETCEHGGGDFRVRRPVAPALPGMRFVSVQAVGVGLRRVAIFDEHQPHFVGRYPRNERFRFVERLAEPGRDVFRVNRLGCPQGPPVGGGVVGIALNFSDQPFRGKAG